ncbi:MAG: bifunctional 5,10-methylenetetrahydrofolate dehydrogenase/5,10-methenyltetrahydrofolate cyclohydrolase [Nanoarchaeota archaeon]|nr:bifunctional 5,10-methylenetetrahydrofolate dehydrogenase/5,10-methenyltetrahydrofolate cyclohydrolase [Nanoarchaeota archaeon]
MAILLDGTKVAASILDRIKNTIKEGELTPSLAIVLCGEKPESLLYTTMKQKKATEIGITTKIHRFPEKVSQEELCLAITELNPQVDGIIIQLPLPKHLDQTVILNSIELLKDVDGLTTESLGRVLKGDEETAPATPRGIIKLLEEYNLPVKGKKITIINHSNILGKPLAMMLTNRGATVTICHEHTVELTSHTKQADILISGIGIPQSITGDMIKEGAVIFDVGISKVGDKIRGDVHGEEVQQKAAYLTPVPGGVGPVTVAMLLEKVVAVHCKKKTVKFIV